MLADVICTGLNLTLSIAMLAVCVSISRWAVKILMKPIFTKEEEEK